MLDHKLQLEELSSSFTIVGIEKNSIPVVHQDIGMVAVQQQMPPNQIVPACEVRFQVTHHVRAFWIHLAEPRSAPVTSPDSVAYMFGMQVPLSHERVLVLGH